MLKDLLDMRPSLILFVSILSMSMFGQKKHYYDDERQIRETRKLSNIAIATHDTLAVAAYWTEDFLIITSRNFEVSGREANRQLFVSDFKTKKDVFYVRNPRQVDVFTKWNMASESGTWTGQWQEPDGMLKLSGTYYAKWHKIDGVWKIRTEIYTPLNCSGSSFCNQIPKL